MNFDGLTILVTGGTGSLGKSIVRRIMTGEMGRPRKIIIFSRDELKQHEMRIHWHRLKQPIEDLREFSPKEVLDFRIGDVREYDTLLPVLRRADVVINTAALKQVPTCEYFPFEAVRTNIAGAYNIVRGIREHRLPVHTVISISTDKACKPVNAMGMTKALQERVILSANVDFPETRFIAVRYGNVLASRGSVIPLFLNQLASGGPLTITSAEMTRFLLTLDQAVDTVFEALHSAKGGELTIPQAASARIIDVAQAIIGDSPAQTEVIGIRPGEKLHEILISEEETHHTTARNGYYVIHSILPELSTGDITPVRTTEFSSAENLLSIAQVRDLLEDNNLLRPEGLAAASI